MPDYLGDAQRKVKKGDTDEENIKCLFPYNLKFVNMCILFALFIPLLNSRVFLGKDAIQHVEWSRGMP